MNKRGQQTSTLWETMGRPLLALVAFAVLIGLVFFVRKAMQGALP